MGSYLDTLDDAAIISVLNDEYPNFAHELTRWEEDFLDKIFADIDMDRLVMTANKRTKLREILKKYEPRIS